ncbi:MAG TPA: alpha/beta hydrolase [Solirubrobacterales bacterium]|jgi:pimeloyl-ACP methyl ester carboxylesterase
MVDPRIVAGSDYRASDREWTRIDWRAHRRRVGLPGASVNYVEIGEGEPLVFVHGVSGCWQNWLGGLVAVELAVAAPEAFERLVLVSAAGIINTWRPEERAVVTAWAWRHFSPLFADRGRQIVTRPRLRRAVFGPFVRFPNRLADDVLVEQIVNGLRQAEGFEPALADLIRTDFRDGLATIEIPTLIVWGLSDRVVPVAAAASYHRRIPHSRLEIFERTGHVHQLERPLRFNALLDEFLE